MTKSEHKNPIVRLLALLPKELADHKRKALEADLLAVGKYQHYRQSVRRENWNMGDTHIACSAVLMRHLGVSFDFFTTSDLQRDQVVDGLVKQAYQAAIPACESA